MLNRFVRSILFPVGQISSPERQRPRPADAERWSHPIPEGEVEAWYLPPIAGGTSSEPVPVVLFAHGNGELIDDWPHALEPYRRLGLGLLLPEFRGYGRSAGQPTEKTIQEDMLWFHDRLVEREDIDSARLVYHGRSLGGGVVAALARQRPPLCMILESTFTSVPDMASRLGVPKALIRDRFDTRSVLEILDRPTLLMHGRRDQIIPYGHAERLAQAARQPRLVSFEGGHNDSPPPEPYWNAIRSLLLDVHLVPATGLGS